MSTLAQIARVIRYVGGSIELARHAVDALRRGDTQTVDEILPEYLATTVARAAANAAAREKFGDDAVVQAGDDDGRA